MAVSSDTRKRWAWGTALRGLLMVIAGLYAVIFPQVALTALVVVAGALLLIDGVIGLWSLTFGGAKSGNFWFDVVRNVLSLITGLVILISPWLATVVGTMFIVYLIAFEAIFLGVMEIVVVVRERELYSKIWPVVVSGIISVLIGIILLFTPMFAALLLVMAGGILIIIYGFSLFGLAWQMNKLAR